MNLRRKVEKAFRTYIARQNDPLLLGYSLYEGSEAQDRILPGFMFMASEQGECFPGGSPKNVSLEVISLTSVDDSDVVEVPSNESKQRTRERHDNAMQAIQEALDDPGTAQALRAALNSGAANRPVTGFHFYDITKRSEDMRETEGGKKFADSVSFLVVCQNCDG